MLNYLFKKLKQMTIMLSVIIFYTKIKAQYTIHAMFMTVLTIIAYIAVHPVLTSIIAGAGITGVEGTLLSWTPLFIILFILWSAVWYVSPHERS